MSNDSKVVKKLDDSGRRPIAVTLVGAIIIILLILVTLEVSHRGVNTFVSHQERYIVALEAAVLSILIVEMLGRLAAPPFTALQLGERGIRMRLLVRVVGYSIAFLSVVSILASDATLGISVGAIVGVIIAFAAQSTVGSVVAAVLLFSTRMVRVGEEITVGGTKGMISDITLTHTVLSIDDDVAFIPNSQIMSSVVRRKKRASGKDANVDDW